MPVAVPATDSPASVTKTKSPLLSAGQHEPVAELIQPYAAFPKAIRGSTVWTKEELIANEGRWKYYWTSDLVRDLEQAYEQWAARGEDLPAITKATFPLPPNVVAFLTKIRSAVVNAVGLALIKGLPVTEWPIEKTAAIYLGIGTQFGITVSQNGKGHILGHVKDIGNDPTQIDKVRIYSTAARQFFHTDGGDLVGLLCLAKAKEGGESDVVSAHHVWNTLQQRRPDVAELLTKSDWHFDRKGERSDDQNDWVKKAVFYYHDGKVISDYDPYFIKSITRHVEAGLIPPHSDAQLEAVQVFEDTAQELALHMILDVGDIQFVADTHVFHARTAYVDYPPPYPRRHLLRLWLATPVADGGWKRPFPDSDYIKRGGVQVNSTPEVCPLEAE
ncbi:hypothetical protein Q5752_003261 [Cryptotrichosporon argae]